MLDPDHRVTVKRITNGYEPEDMSLDVESIAISKAYGQGAGGFQITLTWNRRINGLRYDELLKPNDIIHIELDAGDGKGLRSRMIGLVSRVSRKTEVRNDQTIHRRVLVTGMDFGKMLTTHNCIADTVPEVGTAGPVSPLRIQSGLIFSGTAMEVSFSIMMVLLYNQLPWLESYIEFYADNVDRWQTFDNTILESTGAVWNALKRAANEPYNILTTETLNGKLRIILEKQPFDAANKGKLSRESLHTIPDSQIRQEDLGIDDSDRINYLWFKPSAVTIYNSGAAFPLQYTDLVAMEHADIKIHGFRPFYPSSSFVPPRYTPNDQAPSDIRNEVKTRANEFWEWHRYNHTHESGTLSIQGNPDIKAGDGILLDSGKEYLVESYVEHYIWGQIYTTTLHLTRGQDHGA